MIYYSCLKSQGGCGQSHREQSNGTELLSNGLWNNADEETIQSLMAEIIECLPSTKQPTQAQITLTKMKPKTNTDIVKLVVDILSIPSRI